MISGPDPNPSIVHDEKNRKFLLILGQNGLKTSSLEYFKGIFVKV